MMGVTEGFPPLQHLEINDVWKIPRERKLSITPAMATALLDVDKYIGVDTDSGRTMSTERKDFLWLDTTDQAKNSVSVNGAGGGKNCVGGIGPLVVCARNNRGFLRLIIDDNAV